VSKLNPIPVFRAIQRAGIDVAANRIEPFPADGAEARLRETPAPSAEFVRLYLAIDALRTRDGPIVIQFVAAGSGEGTSTVAAQFARAAAFECKLPILLVDCTGSERDLPVLMEPGSELRSLLEVSKDTSAHDVHHMRLADSRAPWAEFDTGPVQRAMGRARAEFPITILDCAAINQDPRSMTLGRFCDGTVLIVCAESALPTEVQKARDDILRHGGQLLGIVLNRWRSRIPRVLSKFLR
jgi:Mrp family chromosome partitioning ATPase